jgi:hypothetical protein
MARIFTLYVPFEGKECPALVNVSSEGYDLAFRVHYLDRDLYGILPDGNLVFSLVEGLKQPAQLATEGAVRLVDSTVDALSAFFSKQKQPIP